MAIKFKCPHCTKPLAVKDNLAGKRAACPACKKPIVIPAPTAVPADMEAFAAAALIEQPTAQEVKAPEYVDFDCPMCGDPVKLGVEHAGKNAQCPACKNIVKVPLPKVDKPKDWRDIGKKGPTAALMNLPEQLDGAWGTELKGRVGRESLEEAGALPEVVVEPLGLAGWIRRGLLVALVGGVVTLIVFGIKNSRNVKTQQDVIAVARRQAKELDDTKDPKKAFHRILKAQIELADGQLQLRQGKSEKAREQFMIARAMLNDIDKDSLIDHDLFLIELARAQIELGKENEDQFRAKARLEWDRTLKEISQTLQKIKADQAKVMAVRELSCELIARNQVSAAIGLATSLSNAGAGDSAKSPLLPQVTALVFAKGDDKSKSNLALKPPDPKQALDPAARLAYAEGYARRGELDEAKKIAQQIAGPDVNKFEAAVGVACVLLADKSNKDAAAQAAPFVDFALKGKATSAWHQLQMFSAAFRTPDQAAAAKQRAEKLQHNMKRRAQLDWIEAQLEKGNTNSSELLSSLPDNEGPARGLAWLALGRHGIFPEAGSDDAVYTVFAKIGQALGAKDSRP